MTRLHLLFLAAFVSLAAAKIKFGLTSGGVIDQYGYGTTVDSWGNVYISYASNSPLTSFGFRNTTRKGINCHFDTFLTRIPFNSTTQTADWIVQIGGDKGDASFPLNLAPPTNNLAVDINGTVHMVGVFSNQVIVFSTNGQQYTLTSQGLRDVFYIRVDGKTGVVQSAISLGGAENDLATAVAVDINRQAYITGSFSGRFYSDALYVDSPGVQNLDIFLAVIPWGSRNATTLKRIGLGLSVVEEGRDVVVDERGYVWLAGYFGANGVQVPFDSADLTVAAQSFSMPPLPDSVNNGLLARYDPAQAKFTWFTSFASEGLSRVFGLSLSAKDGWLYATGEFQGTLVNDDRDTSGNINNQPSFDLVSAGQSDIFVAKLSTYGDYNFNWTQRIGGAGIDYARDVTTSSKFVFVTGSFSTATLTIGSSIVKAITAGEALWVRLTTYDGVVKDGISGGGASPSNDEAESIIFSPSDDTIYSTVNFFGPSKIGFDTQNPINLPLAEDADFAFLAFTACTPATNPCVTANTQPLGDLDCNLNVTHCPCLAGYSGDFCQINTNECGSNPCRHGGTCNDGVASYTCTCLTGYSGPNCEVDNFDECSSSPCMNGATCTSGTDVYNCACRPGFNGLYCQTNIDECVSNPCLNGGRCVDGDNAFTCSCSSGFTGTICKDTESSVFAIGAVAGGVAAAVGFLILALICYFKCCRREETKQASATPKNAQTPANTGVI